VNTDLASPRAAVGLGAASALLVGLVLVVWGSALSEEPSRIGAPT
jgi:high-affinity Fe2+/Pb2+ permease